MYNLHTLSNNYPQLYTMFSTPSSMKYAEYIQINSTIYHQLSTNDLTIETGLLYPEFILILQKISRRTKVSRWFARFPRNVIPKNR